MVCVCEWLLVWVLFWGVHAQDCCLLSSFLWIHRTSQSCQILHFNYQEEPSIAMVPPDLTLELGLTLRERESDLITKSLKRLSQIHRYHPGCEKTHIHNRGGKMEDQLCLAFYFIQGRRSVHDSSKFSRRDRAREKGWDMKVRLHSKWRNCKDSPSSPTSLHPSSPSLPLWIL